jgi:hypothetical protein
LPHRALAIALRARPLLLRNSMSREHCLALRHLALFKLLLPAIPETLVASVAEAGAADSVAWLDGEFEG